MTLLKGLKVARHQCWSSAAREVNVARSILLDPKTPSMRLEGRKNENFFDARK